MKKTTRTLMKYTHSWSLGLFAIALVLILTACGGSTASTSSSFTGTTGNSAPQQSNLGIVALPAYQVSLFASGPPNTAAPDAVIADNGHIFIDYQNNTAKDCSTPNTSTIVEYTLDGKVVKTFSMPGHSDGLRADPSSHLLWVSTCEDGNPKFATIDPNSGTVTPYTTGSTAHGGGLDDLYFYNGSTYIVGSNPTLDKSGVNTHPALYKMTLGSGKLNLTPVLMGNVSATDNASNSKVTINAIDPDSLTVDSVNGDLVLVDQAGTELIYLSNLGTPQQKVTRTLTGSQLDDTVWASSATGRLLITDGNTNKTYWVSSNFKVGSVYTQTPDDSGVAGLLARVDPGTGTLIPGLARRVPRQSCPTKAQAEFSS